jgi:hypothetical protein
LATMPLAANERLRAALTAPVPEPLYLTHYPQLPTQPPAGPPISEPDGYSSIDLGSATPGYTRVLEDGSVMIMRGGSDIFGATDSCRYVSHPENSDRSDVRATIVSLVDSAEYAKAGVMARWGEVNRPDAAMAMVNIFPDGTVALISRRRAGGRAVEKKVAAGVDLPVELRLQISAGHAVGMYRNNRGDWKVIASTAVPDDSGFHTGIAVCAHGDAVLTTVKAQLGPMADDAVPAPGDERHNVTSGPSLLANGSFEEQGNQSDLAANWKRWGPWMNREAAWQPTHSGSAEIGYHHWQITSPDTSGWWQDVGVAPGKHYTFSIYAQRDIPAPEQTEARTLELRMESVTGDGEVTLNSQTFDISKLATGNEWTRLSVSGTADGPRLRALLVISPAADGPRGGAVKLDDATLVDTQDAK